MLKTSGMQHEVSTFHILINVIVQVLNLLIFFLIFKYFFTDRIIEEVENRRILLDKLKNAEREYQRIINEAEEKKKQILKEAENHKNRIIEEGEMLAKQKAEQILKESKRKADEIIESAKEESYKLKKNLEDKWIESVKYTTKLVVNRLFEEDKQLQTQYLQKLINEFKR